MPTNKAKKDSKVLNSKPETRLTVENFSKMTLEERLEQLDNSYKKLMHGLLGDDWENL
jgi:hypothetical protein